MQKIDKIYFDIDGVLRGTASPQEDIILLLRYCLDHYAGSLYWLTTHCRNGENHTKFALLDTFSKEFADELYQSFLPTNWEALKTDGIDLDSDFVWFDDNLFESEKKVLEKYLVLDSFFKMDPRDPNMAKKALLFLKSFEKPQENPAF